MTKTSPDIVEHDIEPPSPMEVPCQYWIHRTVNAISGNTEQWGHPWGGRVVTGPVLSSKIIKNHQKQASEIGKMDHDCKNCSCFFTTAVE